MNKYLRFLQKDKKLVNAEKIAIENLKRQVIENFTKVGKLVITNKNLDHDRN